MKAARLKSLGGSNPSASARDDHELGKIGPGFRAESFPIRDHPLCHPRRAAHGFARRTRDDGLGAWIFRRFHVVLDHFGREPADVVLSQRLLDIASTPGTVTDEGVRNNIAVALRYLGAWLGGNGAVAVFNLMEDAATAEIARSQVWQWLYNQVATESGTLVSEDLVRQVAAEELEKIKNEFGDSDGYYEKARELFERIALDRDYAEFLTTEAYSLID